ncbi:MAG TPA: helix-turn-helix domain-containing protein [Gammaproteobacteria bacterium]
MNRAVSADEILDAALECAEHRHWETVRLADVAAALDVSLADIHRHFADKESLVDALWDRADIALLISADDVSLRGMNIPERLEHLIFAWLGTLAPHRRTVREMLLVRLEPGHLHIQIPTLLRVSKTVQWLREAAGLRATFAWRALEETALTTLFITVFITWLQDEARAREVLRKGLQAAHLVRANIGPRNDDIFTERKG